MKLFAVSKVLITVSEVICSIKKRFEGSPSTYWNSVVKTPVEFGKHWNLYFNCEHIEHDIQHVQWLWADTGSLVRGYIFSANIYLFKVNNENTRTKCNMFRVNNKDNKNNVTDVFHVFLLLILHIFVNFTHVWNTCLAFLLLTLNRWMFAGLKPDIEPSNLHW